MREIEDFQPLQDVREAWIVRYYGEEDEPEGLDEDVEEGQDLDDPPEWDDSDSDS